MKFNMKEVKIGQRWKYNYSKTGFFIVQILDDNSTPSGRYKSKVVYDANSKHVSSWGIEIFAGVKEYNYEYLEGQDKIM